MSHNQHIIKWLKPIGRTLTSWQAINKWGCTRLAARVVEIREMGIQIESRMVTNKSGKRYSEYFIK